MKPGMKVKRITITIEPDDSLWGFSDLLDDLGECSEEERIENVLHLCNEDVTGLIEDGVWSVEFE